MNKQEFTSDFCFVDLCGFLAEKLFSCNLLNFMISLILTAVFCGMHPYLILQNVELSALLIIVGWFLSLYTAFLKFGLFKSELVFLKYQFFDRFALTGFFSLGSYVMLTFCKFTILLDEISISVCDVTVRSEI